MSKSPKPAAGRGWKCVALALGVVAILEGAGLASSWLGWPEVSGGRIPIATDAPTQTPALLSPTDTSIPAVATTPVTNTPPPTVTRSQVADRHPTARRDAPAANRIGA